MNKSTLHLVGGGCKQTKWYEISPFEINHYVCFSLLRNSVRYKNWNSVGIILLEKLS